MKKVLLVITKANPWGGAQRYVYDLATRLPQGQFAVSVAYGEPGVLAERLAAARIPTVELGALRRDLSAQSDTRSFGALYTLFKRERPDVVHLNSGKAGALGALAARLAGVPHIVFTAHGWSFREKRGASWRALVWLGSWMTALLSHAVICVSKADLELGKQLPFCTKKMHLVYNGIDTTISFGGGEIIRRAFPAGATITGTIGELNRNKNQIALIEQARTDKTMFVAIVGEGELRSFLQAKIDEYGLGERVKLFGFVPAAEVLKGFDRFALPSLKEGLPYVLLEAKAAGLAIEPNPVGGIPEIIEQPLVTFTVERMVAQTAALY